VSPTRRTTWWVGLAAVLVAGIALRVIASLDDFWLDEILSWKVAMSARSVGDLLTSPAARTDNNHLLNTLWLYLLGDRPWWPAYRTLSLATGSAAIVLSAIGLRRVEACAVVVLLAFSYPMVVYSSEARGYAPAIFFAAAGFLALRRFLDTQKPLFAILFSASCILGLLSHLTFAHFYLAAFVLSLRTKRGEDLALLHAPVLVAGIALYFTFIQHITVLGSPDVSVMHVVWQTLRLVTGGSAFLTLLLLPVSLLLVWRSRREWFWFFLTGVLLAPALFLAIRPAGDPLFPRYFLVSTWMAFLLIATAADVAWQCRCGRFAIILLALAYLAGNARQLLPFLRDGRGHYRDALAYAAADSAGPTVTIAGDNEFRARPLIDFYASYTDKPVVAFPPNLPEWFLVADLQPHAAASPTIDLAGQPYAFHREFTYSGGLSGWSWYLYHRRPSAPAPSSTPPPTQTPTAPP
jgi:hypothetical protein